VGNHELALVIQPMQIGFELICIGLILYETNIPAEKEILFQRVVSIGSTDRDLAGKM